jgi:hypothetical protein
VRVPLRSSPVESRRPTVSLWPSAAVESPFRVVLNQSPDDDAVGHRMTACAIMQRGGTRTIENDMTTRTQIEHRWVQVIARATTTVLTTPLWNSRRIVRSAVRPIRLVAAGMTENMENDSSFANQQTSEPSLEQHLACKVSHTRACMSMSTSSRLWPCDRGFADSTRCARLLACCLHQTLRRDRFPSARAPSGTRRTRPAQVEARGIEEVCEASDR